MEIGMLWFDNDKKSSIPVKLARAATYYFKKYGQKPNMVYAHPETLGDTKTDVTQSQFNLEIRESHMLLPNHFWVGRHRNSETIENQPI